MAIRNPPIQDLTLLQTGKFTQTWVQFFLSLRFISTKGDFTVPANDSSTVVTDENVTDSSVILFMPLTANAAIELANATMWVSAQETGQFTITHDNNPQTDRDFRYLVIG